MPRHPHLTTDDVTKLIDIYGLSNAVLYYLIDPDSGHNFVEDPELAALTENLREPLRDFLEFLDLIEEDSSGEASAIPKRLCLHPSQQKHFAEVEDDDEDEDDEEDEDEVDCEEET